VTTRGAPRAGLGWFGAAGHGSAEPAAPAGWFASERCFEPRLDARGAVREVHRHMLAAARGALPALRETFRLLAAARCAQAEE
jgi:hypothetical protein